MKKSMSDAQIPNPALQPFARLVGEWKTVATHPFRQGKTVNGHSVFQWIEGGAFLSWHSMIEEEHFPTGVAIFGSDDASGEFFMIYFDERKVSRKYDVSFEGNVLKWWRNAPGFSQRYSWTFTNDDTIVGKGELSKDGVTWENDLDQTFVRVK